MPARLIFWAVVIISIVIVGLVYLLFLFKLPGQAGETTLYEKVFKK